VGLALLLAGLYLFFFDIPADLTNLITYFVEAEKTVGDELG
jgi:hypothetical protein